MRKPDGKGKRGDAAVIDLEPPSDRRVRAAWAKSDPTAMSDDWFPLYAHLEDTAAVAHLLFPSWFSPSQRALLSTAVGDEDLARRLTVWLAASHDVGKATAAFAMKVRTCRSHMEEVGFEFPYPDPPKNEQRDYPHGFAGQRAVAGYLIARAAGDRPAKRSARRIAEIIGGHHGVFPADRPVSYLFDAGERPCWGEVRDELLRRADLLSELSEADWKRILSRRVTEPVQALFTGFLIVCDWIASNQWLFPYRREQTSRQRAAKALRHLGFGDHWRPDPGEDVTKYFLERFGIAELRPVQKEAVELIARLEEPALVLIEAPTGEGKTEIAFAGAEVLAERFGLHGLATMLPTRATSNAMFGRKLGWLGTAPSEAGRVSVALAHAKAQFDGRFRELAERGRASGVYDDDQDPRSARDSVVAVQWTLARKRDVFADFVVGTIDQLLFMTLKSRHLVLRHLGFSGKVIVLDEVHAADEFMRTYLLRALQWLGAYGVPVIALSATLPPAQRAALLQAYRQGARQRQRPGPIVETSEVDEEVAQLAAHPGYPLVTAIGATQELQVAPARSDRRTSYALEEVDDEDLVEAVLREASSGGVIAVVLDTVNRAQQVYRELRDRFAGEIELLHSRFTLESRNRREEELVARLGPKPLRRPKSMIVVATQVIESSLDVDFDLMFTDLAPADLLIQRMGRVHRHDRPEAARPESMRQARIILSGGSGILHGSEPPVFVDGVKKIYGDAMLLRTSAALRPLTSAAETRRMDVPDDVPEIVRRAYTESAEIPQSWEARWQEAEAELAQEIRSQQERSRPFAIAPPGVGRIDDWSSLAYSEASEEQRGGAQVRDAELSLEVVVVQRKGDRC